jgi:hypothetical protein
MDIKNVTNKMSSGLFIELFFVKITKENLQGNFKIHQWFLVLGSFGLNYRLNNKTLTSIA